MKQISIVLLSVLLFSCSNTESKVVEEKTEPALVKEQLKATESVKEVEETKIQEFSFEDFKGFYVGEFEAEKFGKSKKPTFSNRINISIDSFNTDNKIIFGHSVVAGNSRPFKGEYIYFDESKTISAKVTEPGDNKYDGYFMLNVDANKKETSGNWYANDKNLAVIERSFDLEKKEFTYNPNLNIEIHDDYGKAISGNEHFDSGEHEAITYAVTETNASLKELTNGNLENLSKGDLEIIRNLIYARHGYSFKNRRMRYFFEYYDNAEWYIPVSTDIREDLTEIEIKNIALIKRYEEHAEKYYDYFGR